MLFGTLYDIPVSQWFRKRESELLENLFATSIFEGDALGAGDLIIFVIIACFIIYLLCCWSERKQLMMGSEWRSWHKKVKRTRIQLGFFLINTLCIALLSVQSIKFLMARPRPKQVLFYQDYPFYHWFEVGPQFIADGMYRGSFPSGHTSLTLVMLGGAYCLIFCGRSLVSKWIGYFLYSLTMLLASLMAMHRVMTGSHWITDVIFTVMLGLGITHVLFFGVMRIQEQLYEIEHHGVNYSKPFSELLIGLYFFLFCLGTVSMSIGIRSVLIPHTPILFALVPIGLIMIFLSYRAWRSMNFVTPEWSALD